MILLILIIFIGFFMNFLESFEIWISLFCLIFIFINVLKFIIFLIVLFNFIFFCKFLIDSILDLRIGVLNLFFGFWLGVFKDLIIFFNVGILICNLIVSLFIFNEFNLVFNVLLFKLLLLNLSLFNNWYVIL